MDVKKYKRQGYNFERYIVKKLKEIFPNLLIGTTREYSRALDAKKIDIYVDDDNFPYAIQCKKHLVKTKYAKIEVQELDSIQTNKIKVLITRFTKRQNTNEKVIGEYVTIKLEDFIKIINAENGSNVSE